MHAAAIGYFFAAAFAMALACCGKDPRAKLCAAYLLCSWVASNNILHFFSVPQTIERFSLMDIGSLCVLFLVLLRWPSWWLTILVTSIFGQVVMQAYFIVLEPGLRHNHTALLVNNLLFIPQLVAVVLPTILRPRRRKRPVVRLRQSRIAPPYPGWRPPSSPVLYETGDPGGDVASQERHQRQGKVVIGWGEHGLGRRTAGSHHH